MKKVITSGLVGRFPPNLMRVISARSNCVSVGVFDFCILKFILMLLFCNYENVDLPAITFHTKYDKLKLS